MLNPGDKAPNFTLKNQDQEDFSLSDVLGKKSIVLYFYPKNETLGCTKEACAFRDLYEDFTDAGADVIGVSADSIKSHQAFIANRRLPFTLLSDPDKKVHKLYGVGNSLFGLFSNRITYVIDKEGKVRHAFKSQMNINKHVNDALEMIKKI